MLQPQNYPKMIGQALVFEPDPAVVMVDDDNPWIEGLSFAVAIGFVVAIAQVIGGFLLTASLPNPAATLETILQAVEQSRPSGITPTEWLAFENSVRQWWPWFSMLYSYGNGWSRLLMLVTTPLAFIVQWSFYGFLCHLMAKALGGTGAIGQTMGVTALGLAPQILLIASGVPFVSVGGALLHVWGVLIAYRGIEVAHGFGTRKAATTALVPVFVFLLLALVLAALMVGFVAWVGGGQ